MSEVDVSDEIQGIGQNNEFDVHWIFHYNDGTPDGSVTSRVHVVCADWKARYLPLGQCNPGDIRLDDDQMVPKPKVHKHK